MAESSPEESKSKYFQSLIESAKSSATTTEVTSDQYDLSQFQGHKEGRLAAKFNRVKKAFSGDNGIGPRFVQGFKMGAMVGAVFGTIMGVVFAIQSRNILVIPISLGSMSMSFGFFMGIGTSIRTTPNGPELVQVVALYKDGQWVIEERPAAWKTQLRLV